MNLVFGAERVIAKRDRRSRVIEFTDKALNKALRRLPRGGWDSRYSRQSLSACFLFETNRQLIRPSLVVESPARTEKFIRLAKDQPDQRAGRVARITQQIASGTYRPSSLEIAGSLLDVEPAIGLPRL